MMTLVIFLACGFALSLGALAYRSMDHGNPFDPDDPDLTADPKTAEALQHAYRRGYEEGRDFERSLHPRDEHGRFKSKSK